MQKDDKIYLAGAFGLVGRAIKNSLIDKGYTNLITPKSSEYDLRDNFNTYCLFDRYKPDIVILAAAKVGGINANNTESVSFIVDNILIQTNVIKYCHKFKIKKLLFLGSSCIYPRLSKQPIKEEYLMTGQLEPTNSPYAVAKIAGIEMTRAFNKQYNSNYICAMPTNIFGTEGENFNPETSHVLPGLIHKFCEAKHKNKKEVVCWGDGSPKREFLSSTDVGDACTFLLENYDVGNDPYDNIVNVGCGKDISIKELANFIKETSQYKGDIVWDDSKPNGTPRKLLDCSKLYNIGWKPKRDLYKQIELTYDWYESKYELGKV